MKGGRFFSYCFPAPLRYINNDLEERIASERGLLILEILMRTLNDYFVTAEIEDVSTASSTFVAIPDGGKVIKIITALQGAITTANAAVSFEIGGTAITGGGITVAHSGSAAGTVDTAEPTAANRVEEDGTIEMITDGGSTGTAKLLVTFVIRR
jgi:hypothetical protein